MLEYFAFKKLKSSRDTRVEELVATAAEPGSPVLNDDEEAFLERITSQAEAESHGDDDYDDEVPPPLPERPGAHSTARLIVDDDASPMPQLQTKGKDAQTALMDGANLIPLPLSPPPTPEDDHEQKSDKKKSAWSWVPDIPKRAKQTMRQSQLGAQVAADALAAAAETVKMRRGVEPRADDSIDRKAEAARETQDLANVLEQLNLAAVNNRVFSFSKESQELLDKFKLVLKDLVNGAPHAYADLERLLKDSERQLDSMFRSLPPFLQTLIKQLPTKVTAALAPELLATAAEKPDDHVQATASDSKSQRYAKQGYKYAKKYPPLKKLVSEQGAIAAMLRAILNFLKLRFPAVVTGTNVFMSLAVFILLFVFWYCHKRGREVRLEREATQASRLDDELDTYEPKIVLVPGSKPAGESDGCSSELSGSTSSSSRRVGGSGDDGREPATTPHEQPLLSSGLPDPQVGLLLGDIVDDSKGESAGLSKREGKAV